MSAPQYGRRCNLFVSGLGGEGLDLGQLHVRFTVERSDAQTPNTAEITVYNLADATAQRIRDEFRDVTLQAGYESNYGLIFSGSIKQVRIGRENGTDTFVAIAAADGDRAYNYAVVSTTLAAGSKPADQVRAAVAPMGALGAREGFVDQLEGPALPRGKVMHGMARDYVRGVSQASGATWSIQDGRVQVVRRTAVLPGEAVLLTSRTGLIGAPEQTEKGIAVRCLLNPLLRIGGRVKLDNRAILEASTASASSSSTAPAAFDPDGLYRLLSVKHTGDNFGTDWYSDLVCLAMDASAPAGEEVDAE